MVIDLRYSLMFKQSADKIRTVCKDGTDTGMFVVITEREVRCYLKMGERLEVTVTDCDC